MTWKAPIETLGALHHIIAREIERQKIFYDNNDHNNFLERPGNILTYNKTFCFAWDIGDIHFLVRWCALHAYGYFDNHAVT